MNSGCINFTELHFISEIEMKKYLDNTDEIWTADLLRVLKKNGLLRKTIIKIWNRTNQHKIGILWEYKSFEAFEACQKIIEKQVYPHAYKFAMKPNSLRGFPIKEWNTQNENDKF